jgi:predicted RecB family nuclease
MQQIDGHPIYSASDLNNYLECRRLSELGSLVARGLIERPDAEDPQAELLRRKGAAHEAGYLAALQSRYGDGVVCFERPAAGIAAFREAEERTREAMRRGAHFIYQATFFDGTFVGHADFLRRVEAVPSSSGAWSYEVIDTKLALSLKPYFLVQLCNYSEHLERAQGVMPEYGYIVLGNGEERRFRLRDYLAYYRHLKNAFLDFARAAELEAEPQVYPFECRHCGVCVWNQACSRKRIEDDHLSLVARIRRDQIRKLEGAGISSVAALAAASDVDRPRSMGEETFVKLRRQAKLQVAGRANGPVYELLAHAPEAGFGLLPAPCQSDVFFDMEGDPLYQPGRSLEYLFGCWLPGADPSFRAFWGLTREEERNAFESFVDFIVERRRHYPAMHVYHYAPYEKAALRRLAQEHCTREDEVDDLLRGEVLVDLFAVVRQMLAISEEHYGLKNLERFYAMERETEVRKGGDSVLMFERWLIERDPAILRDIEAYNRDDCRSTHLLREWLIDRRAEYGRAFGSEPAFRPAKPLPERAPHERQEEAQRGELERSLLRCDTPESILLAHLLAYHRREEKPAWWQFFDRCENVDRLEFDRDAIGGLQFQEHVPPVSAARGTIYTYFFPEQPYKLAEGDAPYDPATRRSAGTIVEIDHAQNLLRLKRTGTPESARALSALIPSGPISTREQQAALARIARACAGGTLEAAFPATFDLLANRAPRLSLAGFRPDPTVRSIQPAQADARSISRVVQALDRSYLFIQGPPGSGKTTTGAEIICDLLQSGKRIAMTSTGHKAIHHLLRKVEAHMAERGKCFRGLYKHTDGRAGSEYTNGTFVQSVGSNEPFARQDYDLAAGTAWLFSRQELTSSFDYLFIDEAGQVALADAIAVSACAHNVVLLGDPLQLAQVSQGTHPMNAGASVLQHLLGDEQTVPPSRGIFLDVSHRMHPEICAFVSEMMYGGRLKPAPSTASHCVTVGGEPLAGLLFVPIEHAGNSSCSPEEAAWIASEIARFTRNGVAPSAIIVVTPYNAQRRLIERRLAGDGIAVEVGTVDTFQGKEADVVFYSMATSSGEDVPHDLEFLFERNRLNVAISRARALSVLVCSPRLLDVACRTPDEMALVNLLCAFKERAQPSARERAL